MGKRKQAEPQSSLSSTVQKYRKTLFDLFVVEKTMKDKKPPNVKKEQEGSEWKEYMAANPIEKCNFKQAIAKMEEIENDDDKSNIKSDKSAQLASESMSIDVDMTESAMSESNDNLMMLDSVESSVQSLFPHFGRDSEDIKRMKLFDIEESSETTIPVFEQIPNKEHLSNKSHQLLSAKLKIGARSLCSVLPRANKVVTTQDWKLAGDEVRIGNVLDRVDRLKESNQWSFKQLKRQAHPPRAKIQWDYMLEEMEWMSEDFVQERRWKIATAYNMAQWVVQWHESADKRALCINPRSPNYIEVEDQSRPENGISVLAEEIFEKDTLNQSTISEAEKSIKDDRLIPSESINLETAKAAENEPKTVNPQSLSLPITVNLMSNCYSVKGGSPTHGLSHLPTFEPPSASKTDTYTEDVSIVPISKFMLGDFQAPRKTCWEGSQIIESSSSGMKRLPSLEMYTPLPENPVFFSKDVASDDFEFKLPTEPKIDANQSQPSSIWTSDEEEALWQFGSAFSGNWSLISDSLNGIKVGNSGRRSCWACYEKYMQLSEASFVPDGKSDFLYSATQSNKKDKKVKVLGLLSTFNFIINLAKRNNKPSSKSNKAVSLTAHETHRNAQINAGVDVNAPALRPIELSRLKEQREKILEQTRQSMFHARPNVGLPRHPGPYRPIVRPANGGGAVAAPPNPVSTQFRPPFQDSPQMNTQMMSMGSPMQGRFNADLQQQYLARRPQMEFNTQQQPQKMQVQSPTASVGVMQHQQRMQMQGGPTRPNVQVRTQLVDASTAAAYASLQNAVTKGNVRPTTAPVPKKRGEKKEEALHTSHNTSADPSPTATSTINNSTSVTDKKTKRNSRQSIASTSSKSRGRKKAAISESEEEDEENELEPSEGSTSVEESEPASPQVKKRTRRSVASRKNK